MFVESCAGALRRLPSSAGSFQAGAHVYEVVPVAEA